MQAKIQKYINKKYERNNNNSVNITGYKKSSTSDKTFVTTGKGNCVENGNAAYI